VPALESVGVELEGAEERARAQGVRGRERIGQVELEAMLRGQRGHVHLSPDVVRERDRPRPERGLAGQVGMPLHGRLRPFQPCPRGGYRGEAGRDAAKQDVVPVGEPTQPLRFRLERAEASASATSPTRRASAPFGGA
jgi:hypothetical protein